MDELGAPAETVETPATEAPAVTQAPAPAAENAAPAEPQSRRDVIAAAMRARDGTNRGQHATRQPREQGKFAGPPEAAQKPAQAPQANAEPAAPRPRPALLKSLKRDLEPHWNNAPQELVEAFAEREAAFEKGAQQWQSKAQVADAILEQFRPYEQMLRAEGATPQTAIAPLLQTAAILRTGSPMQKAQSVAQVIHQFGVPLEQVQAILGGQQAVDPNYSHLAQQVQSLQQTWQQAQQQQEQVQTQRALTVIQQFAAENAHFEQAQPKMLALLQAPEVFRELTGQDPTYLSEREKLTLAYKTVLSADPVLSQQALAQQQAEAQRQLRERSQQAANVAKAAAVQVRGAPGAPVVTTANPTDRRSVIANALRAAQA